MNGLKVVDDETVPPQMFIYGCVLESGKEVKFCPDDDGFEHLLDLRMACTDPATKDELHLVEVEGKDCDGEKVTATLASLKPSTLPSVSLGGFSIPPPAVLRLKCGAGPIHISGQYLVSMDYNPLHDDDDDDDDDDDEEEEEEEEEDVKVSKKRPAASPASKSQKKMKMDIHMDEDDDDDDNDDDNKEKEETPVKAKPVQKSTQNGKSPKANAATPKQVKTPKQKEGKSPKSPTTPKETLSLPEIQAKMNEAAKKGVALPKIQSKFENFVKNSFRVSDAKVVAELWKWRQTVADPK